MRQHDRHLTSIRAVFRTAGETVHGTVIDISMGGVGLETVQPAPAEPTGSLDLYVGNERVTVPCRIRHARPSGQGVALHLQFVPVLSQPQHDALDRIVRELAQPRQVSHLRPQALVDRQRSQPRRAV